MLKTELRRAQDEYIGSTLDCDQKEKPKKFWSYIKSKKQDQVGVPPLNVNGSVKTDSASKAEILSTHFRQIFTQEDLSSMPSKGCSDTPPMDSVVFKSAGVEHLLKNLDSKKANGPDKLPTILLKITASEIAEVVTFLFNQSYDSGELPEDWRNAHVVPIFKKGAKHDPSNYRPVSLTAVLCKLMEHVVYKDIMNHLENFDILFANQYGFRKNHSCETQLILIVEDLARNIDNGDQMDMIILDFSKAFDKVPHRRLLNKLEFYGIQGKTLKWIESWLTTRTQSVIVDGVCSSSVAVTSGVPQGTVLGPLMFLLFINDIQEDLECSLRLFADDALLYYKVSQERDTLALQRDLCKLGLWADKWQMVFNPSKCYQMTVHRTRSPVHKDYTLYNQSLKAVQQHPYLGVLLSHDLRWNHHVDKIVKKANSSLGFVKRNLYLCSERTKRAAYITLVRPHLEYASAVWDPYQHNQVDQIEAVQNRAARFIKNNYEFTSSVSQMKHDLSLESLCERRKHHRLHIFHKAVNSNIALPVPNYYLHPTRLTRNSKSSSYIQPMAHCDYYAQSFFPKTIKQWNSISPQIRELDYLSFCSELY